ncbi:MAG: multiple sugar transport system permease protein [Chloroflexota bacterium]|jgi:multiple sugar transport system permease protein|nr:multiple sugar transport system permease protein [Chloroflexota bacterium]MEA2605247.1 multiple sugar transport system permease protein [Chloroflexota bacterium]
MRLSRVAPMVALIVLAAIYLTPFVWMVSSSLKTLPQSLASPPVLIPNPIVIKPFTDALSKMNYPLAFRNTLIYAVPAVIGTVVSCSLVAYGFALVQWRGRNTMFLIVLATMMLPSQVTLIPLYVIYAKLGWINTYLPLLVPTFLGSPFFIFLLRQFFMGMPKELIDAARLDGASELRILATIVAPLSAPALITVGILTFIDKWNDFYGPLIYLQKPELQPLSLAVQVFQTQHGTDWPLLMAASVLVAAPLVVLYFVAQRKFIEGITLTGLKG